MLNQREFRNWRFTTLALIKAVVNGHDLTIAFCDETETLYKWDSTSGATADDKLVLITGVGGTTRWIAIAGQYTYVGGGGGVNLGFGASMGAGDVGKYIQPHGDANGGKFSTLTSESQINCPVTKIFNNLAWLAQGDPVLAITNAVLKVWKNGIVVKTITISAAAGSPAKGLSTGLSISVTANDLIAVEYDAVGTGTALKKTILELS